MNEKFLSYFKIVPYYMLDSREIIFIKRKLLGKIKVIIYRLVNDKYEEALHYKREPFIDGVMFELDHKVKKIKGR